ncbi:hypothetical protein DEDE109153_04450 [Deinococcus deserti]|uniref:Uncharacterized protein n=1 Tax=Deinococcus deserti (strain DSM 17065 / CIP 109153 / LMG 22923 / VCD115) TaxID=546414 RepID=C1D0W6_DEIDV|nr:hypothetical protein [Deinococcus deserti]ACO45490.1 Hypothetical protein Deide_06450 [Deinococcus deserti VCD115]
MSDIFNFFDMPALRLKPLPKKLQALVSAAAQNKLPVAVQLADREVHDLGVWVLECAAKYATGRYPERRLRDLWEAYGVWKTHPMKP